MSASQARRPAATTGAGGWPVPERITPETLLCGQRESQVRTTKLPMEWPSTK